MTPTEEFIQLVKNDDEDELMDKFFNPHLVDWNKAIDSIKTINNSCSNLVLGLNLVSPSYGRKEICRHSGIDIDKVIDYFELSFRHGGNRALWTIVDMKEEAYTDVKSVFYLWYKKIKIMDQDMQELRREVSKLKAKNKELKEMQELRREVSKLKAKNKELKEMIK